MTGESDYDDIEFDSRDVLLVEFNDRDLPSVEPCPLTPAMWLSRMRGMVRAYGYPLPPGFLRPPGIDIDALLRQVPWPPPSTDHDAADDQQQPR